MTTPDALAAQLRESLRLGVYALRLLDREGELPTTQVGTLMALKQGPLPVTTIATLSGISTASASQQVTRLENAGYVERRPDPLDARGVLVAVTDSGLDALHLTVTARNKRLSPAMARLSQQEREDVARALPVLERFFRSLLDE
ncbi:MULTISPECIES: MarR family winged helix-turn-helix transcriptional regulator [unclassified Corynebacterium]|uniref:MarR family winged helix-turn-helix transcriptional regulator n=1 Tax=unclassified Corynebacterium TaxID=2624378 RepID=UPI0029C9DF29|nr:MULTISPECIES: MarR family transcriptional regulator [unclassified Corynebacterium]WPF65786.1 MarR family transcriptional regulator [Corynebacterium sp. 22KM0430]WPF68280.1 MarR family transcriptional regulator [Corynebacterium sp. 21KM1197]